MESPAFISEVDQKRSKHFDTTLENTTSCLDLPEVVASLGHAATDAYKDVLTRLRIPNFIHDAIDTSHFGQDDIPYIPLLQNEIIEVSPSQLPPTARQAEILQAKFGMGVMELMERASLESVYFDQVTILDDYDAHIMVGSDFVDTTLERKKKKNIRYALMKRPFLVEDTVAHPCHFSPALIHELTHVWQVEREPYEKYAKLAKRAARFEFEAYSRQDKFTDALVAADKLDTLISYYDADYYLEIAEIIERLREKHHDPLKPYTPNKSSVRALLKRGYDITGDLEEAV